MTTAGGLAEGALVRELALALRERVAPALGSHAGRAHAGAGPGGDVTFAIDEHAEAFLRMFVAYGLRGRPMSVIAAAIGELIDAASVGGATFDLGSATYDMTGIATGQLDAYVEPGPRIVADVPGTRASSASAAARPSTTAPTTWPPPRSGSRRPAPVVTDAYRAPLADRRLLGSGPEYQISCICAANRELRAAILAGIDRGIERLASAA